MKYKFYTTSQKAWDGMFKAMSSALKSIYIEMYIFLDDTQATHNFLGLLKEKARTGLEIVVIADAYGSSSLKNGVVDDLKSAGVEFIFFSHWFRHTHRKILIIDNKVAFIGGVNIEEKIRNWRDLQIRLQGNIVKPLLKSFAYAYEMAGGKKESVLKYSRLPLIKKIKAWITDNFSVTNKIYYLNDYYRRGIAGAVKTITIVTPYLLPPRWFIALLDNACRRGVSVEILIPQDTDIKPLNKVNYLNACRLAEYGVKVYSTPFMNHAKIMLIDGSEGVVGSQNIDILSFGFNIEAGVFFRQKDLVYDLIKIIERWKNDASFLEATRSRIKWYDKILILILKIFYPIF
ncbi:MAG: phosphatidylserine/phosphatidylglycerophosphate/cardiolipin synthase family protein [Patescibacteria group bacterium]|jgi:cardiolipin synthase